MKGKLVKRGQDTYILLDVDSYIIATNNDRAPSNRKLLKQNCDEIFGVIDVEKLAENEYPTFNLELNLTTSFNTLAQAPFINGFNKAMELNKDKLFTLEDMQKAFELGHNGAADTYMLEKNEQEFEKLIQQPTEIEVEILCLHTGDPEYTTNTGLPKLDENNCLILKKL
jgi:hypothetical protein